MNYMSAVSLCSAIAAFFPLLTNVRASAKREPGLAALSGYWTIIGFNTLIKTSYHASTQYGGILGFYCFTTTKQAFISKMTHMVMPILLLYTIHFTSGEAKLKKASMLAIYCCFIVDAGVLFNYGNGLQPFRESWALVVNIALSFIFPIAAIRIYFNKYIHTKRENAELYIYIGFLFYGYSLLLSWVFRFLLRNPLDDVQILNSMSVVIPAAITCYGQIKLSRLVRLAAA